MILQLKKAVSPPTEENYSLRILLVALATAVVFHGGLLPFTHGNTYDAFIHMFFGDHYHRSWFDPWEPRWYTGFATTSYPPGTHMMMGALMYIMPLRAAFVVVQLAGLLLLVIGVYRNALLWVSPRAAAYAALALVFSSSIAETVHLFGQLPTIFSLAFFLNAQPHFYRWIVYGGVRQLFYAVLLAAATTAAHHVTTIFAGVLFVLPLAVQSLRAYGARDLPNGWHKGMFRYWRPFARGILLAILMIMAVAITVFPYWYWSITDPITQVLIPHGSRESFLVRLDLGMVFFIIPWGVTLFLLPYMAYKSLTSSLWPLGLSITLCLILGTGGTTPIPRIILRGAFDILTLDRFTFWGTILILPFIGVLLDGLLHGRSRSAIRGIFGITLQRAIVGGLLLSMAAMASYVSVLTTIQPTQPRYVNPAPIVRFLEEDQHYRWRYLTLGFGDQFAYLSAQTTAQSVDGNYHSARRLPDLTRFSVERLENAKYLGVPGLGSLEQFVINADKYYLKYVMSNDAFYDPLLFFNGWNRLNRLGNGIIVWEKPDITPLPLLQPRRGVPVTHAVMWGILPPLALITGVMVLLVNLFFGRSTVMPTTAVTPSQSYARPKLVRYILACFAVFTVLSVMFVTVYFYRTQLQPQAPESVIRAYYDHLDFRRFRAAYDSIDPEFRPSYDNMLFRWMWKGGLVNSYGKLESISVERTNTSPTIIDFDVNRSYLTGVTRIGLQDEMRVIKRNGVWRVAPIGLQPVQAPVRLQRQTGISWRSVGRRQARPDLDVHRNRLDRPRLQLNGGRVVTYDGRHYIIGQLNNLDHDPAAISVFGTLYANETKLSTKAMGKWGGHRLLPAESAGFKVEFDGVLSLKDALERKAFDPEEFLPPEFEQTPTNGNIVARALVKTDNMYRGVGLNSIRFEAQGDELIMTGLAVNTGTQTASITRVNVLLYDISGDPIWVDAGFVESNIYPGQSTDFKFKFPAANLLSTIDDIAPETVEFNGSSQLPDDEGYPIPTAKDGTLALNGIAGYSAARLHISVMTHEPLF